MLGFSCVQEFICKYYRLLVTMILPYCVKAPLCKGLIVSISKITRKPVTNLFVVSFLRIYTHIYLTEDSEIGNACIEFIGKCTGSSLSKLMNTDVKVDKLKIHNSYSIKNKHFLLSYPANCFGISCLLQSQPHFCHASLSVPSP